MPELGRAALATAFLLLVYAFLTFDFSVRYVAINTNLETPFYYRITAVWGALEGSIILWSWMLALYTLIVILRHRHNARTALDLTDGGQEVLRLALLPRLVAERGGGMDVANRHVLTHPGPIFLCLVIDSSA